ncbi:MAG: zf-TFIIB domain-containing protein [Acidimicrobiales bacterium]|nr:zf-TFIIB domain-containing protein [Acidimicrobiales bacterium]MCB9394963.1 zf-TFIIB domain-containing protein [Acidimicrobiaceae bacterium]
MKCPIDTTVDLVMTDRQGIEIDYCPTCRGVWLDRGELDKIIERTAAPAPVAPVAPMAPQYTPAGPMPADPAPRWDDRRRWDDDDDDDRYRSSRDGYRKKKRSSLLGEIFDF